MDGLIEHKANTKQLQIGTGTFTYMCFNDYWWLGLAKQEYIWFRLPSEEWARLKANGVNWDTFRK